MRLNRIFISDWVGEYMLKDVKENNVILREGEDDSKMYKVVSGKVEVYVGYQTESETIMGILSEGQYFGELGAFTDEPSIYTVVAYNDCLILEIERHELDVFAKNNYRDLLAIMTNMSKSMIFLKANIDLLNQDILALINDRENEKKAKEIRNRIISSDVTKQLFQYKMLSGGID